MVFSIPFPCCQFRRFSSVFECQTQPSPSVILASVYLQWAWKKCVGSTTVIFRKSYSTASMHLWVYMNRRSCTSPTVCHISCTLTDMVCDLWQKVQLCNSWQHSRPTTTVRMRKSSYMSPSRCDYRSLCDYARSVVHNLIPAAVIVCRLPAVSPVYSVCQSCTDVVPCPLTTRTLIFSQFTCKG